MVTRETARLVLRPLQASDADAFMEIHEDPEVLRHISGRTTGRAGAWRMLALMIGHWHLRGYGQWAVVERASREIIGRVGLWNPDGWPGIEVGWVIRRSRWGQGFATEAAREALRYGFEEVGADHLISLIRPDNVRSMRVADKLGETPEGRYTLDGVEAIIYGISRERWLARPTEP